MLSHIQHEVLGGSIGTFHGDTIAGFSHCFGVSGMLNGVVNTYDSGYIVAGQVIVFSYAEFSFYNLRTRCQLGNDLLSFFASNVS